MTTTNESNDSYPGVAESGLGVGETCPSCRGEGAFWAPRGAVALDPGTSSLERRTCTTCAGTGRVPAPPSAPVRPPQTVPDQVLTPLSLAWDALTQAARADGNAFEYDNDLLAAQTALEAAIRAPLEARILELEADMRFIAASASEEHERHKAAERVITAGGSAEYREALDAWRVLLSPAALAGVPKEAE